MIPKTQAPTNLPTLREVDDYLAFLKNEQHAWREFRKVVAAREPQADTDDGSGVLIVSKAIESVS